MSNDVNKKLANFAGFWKQEKKAYIREKPHREVKAHGPLI